jgi:hypothetical protein
MFLVSLFLAETNTLEPGANSASAAMADVAVAPEPIMRLTEIGAESVQLFEEFIGGANASRIACVMPKTSVLNACHSFPTRTRVLDALVLFEKSSVTDANANASSFRGMVRLRPASSAPSVSMNLFSPPLVTSCRE